MCVWGERAEFLQCVAQRKEETNYERIIHTHTRTRTPTVLKYTTTVCTPHSFDPRSVLRSCLRARALSLSLRSTRTFFAQRYAIIAFRSVCVDFVWRLVTAAHTHAHTQTYLVLIMPDMLLRLGRIGAWQHWQKLNLHCDSEAKALAAHTINMHIYTCVSVCVCVCMQV